METIIPLICSTYSFIPIEIEKCCKSYFDCVYTLQPPSNNHTNDIVKIFTEKAVEIARQSNVPINSMRCTAILSEDHGHIYATHKLFLLAKDPDCPDYKIREEL